MGTARAHDLVALPSQIPDRRAPDVHQPGKRKDQEDGHAKEQVRLEKRVHIGCKLPGICPQEHDTLRPRHQPHHFVAVQMTQRDDDRRQAKQQLGKQQEQNGDIAERRCLADARIGQSAMGQERDADKAGETRHATDNDRQDLLEAVADTERIEHGNGRQQPEEMPKEDDQDTDMKQI